VRFRGGQIRDSVVTIPKGVSARVLHRVFYVYFQPERFRVTQNVLDGSFIADLLLSSGPIRLDSARWIQEYDAYYRNVNGQQYCRYRIPAR
jgi:hypothetical protein